MSDTNIDPAAAVAATSTAPATPGVAPASPEAQAAAVEAVTAPAKVSKLPQGATPVVDPGDASPIGWHDGTDHIVRDQVYEYGTIDPASGLPILHTREILRSGKIER